MFLLFLDCASQLLLQFPSAFQFTEVYLTSLWDSICLGLFRNFLFNSVRQSCYSPRRQSEAGVYTTKPTDVRLMSVWDWDKQFSADQISLFQNPLYVVCATNEDPEGPLIERMMSGPGSNRLIMEDRIPASCVDEAAKVLRPDGNVTCLQLWSLCYLRWLQPVQIVGGGPAAEYLARCVLVEEIVRLRQRVANAETPRQRSPSDAMTASDRRRSVLIFGGAGTESPRPTEQTVPRHVSSSFPFDAGPLSDRHPMVGILLDSYVENSFINEDDG